METQTAKVIEGYVYNEARSNLAKFTWEQQMGGGC